MSELFRRYVVAWSQGGADVGKSGRVYFEGTANKIHQQIGTGV